MPTRSRDAIKSRKTLSQNRSDRPIRLGLLISGGGRSLENLVARIADGRLQAEIAVVISSRGSLAGVEKARAAGLPCEVVRKIDTSEAAAFDAKITERLLEAEVDLVVMAGFLVFWRFPEPFAGRVINIHPALLPKYGGQGMYGDRVHRAVLAAGEKVSGCTVHYVDHLYDHGPVILQRSVPVQADDTVESLAARVFEQECEALPEAIGQIGERLKGEG